MYSKIYLKNELLIFSIINTLEDLINPNLIYRLFKVSLNSHKNIFSLSQRELQTFLMNNCHFNEIQIEKLLKIFDNTSILELRKKADFIYQTCNKNSISLFFYSYENYPKSLLNLKKPPYVLYTKGNFALNSYKIVALVGTRNMSKNGLIFTENFAQNLKKHNYFNISGLALGIDTVGHIGTLGNTGAILAQGLLTEIYPKENRYLANDILQNNGFLLSELPPFTNISVNNLINRNRLQVALSDFLVIAETEIKGGTVHTFKFAREQEKKVFVADFNKNFIEKYQKDIIIVSDFEDFQKKMATQLHQEKLF